MIWVVQRGMDNDNSRPWLCPPGNGTFVKCQRDVRVRFLPLMTDDLVIVAFWLGRAGKLSSRISGGDLLVTKLDRDNVKIIRGFGESRQAFVLFPMTLDFKI